MKNNPSNVSFPPKRPLAIEVKKLCFHYLSKFPILKDVSFGIPQGTFIGIFGPNGGGKTTLLKLLLGLLKPSSGSVKILGASPFGNALENIGYVPQLRGHDMQFPISALEVVLHGLLSKHKGWGNFSADLKEKGYRALDRVGMRTKAKEPFASLSGGQAQRVLIARALVSDPKILLLDEATVGIDPQNVKDIFEIILQEKENMTTLLVTHQLKDILKEMDFLLCVNQTLSTYTPDLVCQHFSLGLYHPPMLDS